MAAGTLADIQFDEAPPAGTREDVVTAPNLQPDITKHTPDQYAGLMGQQALQRLHAQGLMPTVETITGIENDALKAANDFHQHIAEQQASAQTEIAKRAAAVTTGVSAAEEQIKTQAAEAQKQWEQGPTAVAKAQELAKAGTPGEVAKLGADDMAKLDAMTNGYDAVNNLGLYFNKMMEKPRLGVGGQIRSLGGLTQTFADATSPEALAFSRASDAALVPIGRGVMGETGASPTKESMIELAKNITMPRIQDDDLTGNQGVFQLKQRILQNLQNLRDNRANAGIDTTPIDKAIAKYNSDFMSPQVQKYNPLANQGQVQIGTSDQANATMTNTNAGANAGIVMPQAPLASTGITNPLAAQQAQQPNVTVGPGADQNFGRQSLQANQQIGHAVANLAGLVAQQPGEQTQALGNIWNAIQNVWGQGVFPQSAYQKPRPWEPQQPEYVGQ